MRLMNNDKSWGALSRLLHWAMAGLIFYMLWLGIYMVNFVDNPLAQFPLYQTHKSWGFVALVLVGARLAWRAANRAHPALPEMPALERFAARAGHVALYALMIILPVTGWLMASASPLQDLFGIKNEVFGLFEMYDPFVPGDEGLESVLSTLHLGSAVALVVVLLGHIGAALRHHFAKRDDVLKRMSWGA